MQKKDRKRNDIRNIKMIVSYEGTSYKGWQRLQGKQKMQSVQGVLETVLETILHEPIRVIGASRTDAYVHAKGQVLNFHTACQIPEQELQIQLNQVLPDDIRVIKVEEVSFHFHSRYDSKGKCYEYIIDTREKPVVYTRNYVLHHPGVLYLDKMREAASCLIGTYDYIGFSSEKREEKSTIRTIQSITISKEKEYYRIRFVGDGFLYNMIRIIVGTLIEVGEGKRTIDSVNQILITGKRQLAGPTVKGNGLTLCEVYY